MLRAHGVVVVLPDGASAARAREPGAAQICRPYDDAEQVFGDVFRT